jgi:hypothetical protein
MFLIPLNVNPRFFLSLMEIMTFVGVLDIHTHSRICPPEFLNCLECRTHRPSEQKCNSDGVIGKLAVVKRTSNLSSSFASTQLRLVQISSVQFSSVQCSSRLVIVLPLCVVIADRGFGGFFGRMEKGGNVTQLSAEDARNVSTSRLCITSLDDGSSSQMSLTIGLNKEAMREMK